MYTYPEYYPNSSFRDENQFQTSISEIHSTVKENGRFPKWLSKRLEIKSSPSLKLAVRPWK